MNLGKLFQHLSSILPILDKNVLTAQTFSLKRLNLTTNKIPIKPEYLKKAILKFNRNLLLQYLEARKKEEKIVRKKSERIKDIKANIKKYGLTAEKINPADLTKWDKQAKRKKIKSAKLTEELTIDLDQANQEPSEEELAGRKIKPKSKKK